MDSPGFHHPSSARPARSVGSRASYDAVIVGAGPNGLAAAVELARRGLPVAVFEAAEVPGGGCRSQEVTLPGFVHDLGSAIHPLGYSSPFFRTLPLGEHGLEWVHPPVPLAHPLEGGEAVLLWRSVEETARNLGEDASAYRDLMSPITGDWEKIAGAVLGPPRMPRHPLALGAFGMYAMRSARALAEGLFRGERARALFAGCAAHSFLPLEQRPSAAFGLVLAALGHAAGWPFPKGGAQRITDALVSCLRSLGGEVHVGSPVSSVAELPAAKVVLLDLTPRQVLGVAGERLPARYRARLARYRYGPGVFKVDYALEGPVPWEARECALAATVHVGGTLEEIAGAEGAVARGEHPERPFVLVAQPSLFDPSRAPEGHHTLWAYCHVPNGSTFDMTERMEAQLERFAPGFRERILARSTMNAAELERWDANLVGGDINGGLMDLGQLFTRPVASPVPYATPAKGLYICSSSTPPGGGVHGMCGYFAARAALRDLRRGRL